MRPLLVAAVGRALTASPLGRREGDLELLRVPALPSAGSLPAGRPIVVLLDGALAAVAALVGVGDPGEEEPPEYFPTDLLTSYVAGDAAPGLLIAQLRGAFRHAVALLGERNARADEGARQSELAELTRVGAALTTERNLSALLDMILTQARRITGSDAGSIYLAPGPSTRQRLACRAQTTRRSC